MIIKQYFKYFSLAHACILHSMGLDPTWTPFSSVFCLSLRDRPPSSLTESLNLLFGLPNRRTWQLLYIFSILIPMYPVSLLFTCPNHLNLTSLALSLNLQTWANPLYDDSENSHAVRLGNGDTDEKVAELRMLWFSLGVKRKDISRND